jgi:hypothetical protein
MPHTVPSCSKPNRCDTRRNHITMCRDTAHREVRQPCSAAKRKLQTHDTIERRALPLRDDGSITTRIRHQRSQRNGHTDQSSRRASLQSFRRDHPCRPFSRPLFDRRRGLGPGNIAVFELTVPGAQRLAARRIATVIKRRSMVSRVRLPGLWTEDRST